jgi:hypothetical protein
VSQEGFGVGHPVVIAPGTPQEEIHEIAAFGSMILKTPLNYPHEAGVEIASRHLLAHGPPPPGGSYQGGNKFNHWVTNTFGTAKHPKVATIAGAAVGGVAVAGSIAAAAVAATKRQGSTGTAGTNPLTHIKNEMQERFGRDAKHKAAFQRARTHALPAAGQVPQNLPTTSLAANVPAGASIIQVQSIVGMAIGDTIKIGDQWNLIKGFPGSVTKRRLLGGSSILLDHPMFSAVTAGTSVRIVHEPANANRVGAPTPAPAPVTIAATTPVVMMKADDAPVTTAKKAPSTTTTARIIFFSLLGGVGVLTICCCICVIVALISKARKQDAYYGVDEEQGGEEDEDEEYDE